MNKFTNTGPLYNLIKWSFILLILVDTNRIIADESNSVLRIGGHTDVLFDARRQDAEISFNLMFSEFLQEVGETSTVTIYSDAKSMYNALINKDIDAIFTTPIDLLPHSALVNTDRLFTVVVGKHLRHRYLLLVRVNSKIKDIHDLRNKKLTTSKGHQMGVAYTNALIQTSGLPEIDQFFNNQVQVSTSNTAIIDLFFYKTDSALVTEEAFNVASELNPQIAKQIKAIHRSPPLLLVIVAIRKEISVERVERLASVIKRIHEFPRGKKILSLFRATRVAEVSSKELERASILLKGNLDALNE